MKKYFILAAAALAFAACTNEDAIVAEQAEQQVGEGTPVAFDAYLNRATTRAGAVGKIETSSLKTTGFGVFAYYTDNRLYNETSIPNFMYNQKVEGDSWDYAPQKYWPNEFGNDAISYGQDRLTFFAYAPWVDVKPSTGRINTGSETSGIVGLTNNITGGDPYVKYYVDFNPANRVDLCWGVANSEWGEDYAIVAGIQTATAIGSTFQNMIKPTVTKKIDFNFKHALAWLNVQIDADIDKADHSHSNPVADGTKIFVRSVTFEGFATKGLLNLNASASEGPKWFELSSTNTSIIDTPVTLYDGLCDGREGQSNVWAPSETPYGLNPEIIQSYTSTDGQFSGTTGVTNTAVNLFDNAATSNTPIFVIPTKQNLKITVVYDVETKDENLATYLSDGKTRGSSVENKISKEISWTNGGSATPMEAGYKYTVNLHLGLTSVKFDASVAEWQEGDNSDTDLPFNAN